MKTGPLPNGQNQAITVPDVYFSQKMIVLFKKESEMFQLDVFFRPTWSVKETRLCIMIQVQEVSRPKTLNAPPERISSNKNSGLHRTNLL